MTCPVCGGNTTVVECRKDCETVIRRRKCVACGYAFLTEETESDCRGRFSELRKEYRAGLNSKHNKAEMKKK